MPASLRRTALPVRLIALALALVATVAFTACSDDGDGASSTTSAVPRAVDTGEVLTALATDVIVPAYADLGEQLDALTTAVTALCAAPSTDALGAARESWATTAQAWQRTRAFGVGPALDERLLSDVGFPARSRVITLKLSGTDPVDVAAIAEEGAAGRGIYAVEELLFGQGSEALATGDARRCEYAQSVATLAQQAAAPIVAAWTTGDAATAFAAGLDGGPESTVALLLNEVSHRLEELDMMQFRDMTTADGFDDLDVTRQGGPSAQRLAERAALMGGIADAIGDGDSGISALVGAKDADTADRMVAATAKANDDIAALPPSVEAAFDDPEAIKAASDAVAKLKVLVSTEAASKLGVTITFSDSDGDS